MNISKIIVIIFLFLSSNLSAKANVKNYLGKVEVKEMAFDKWIKINHNQKIKIGDEIRTEKKSFADIDIDGNIIKINENSRIKLSQVFDNEVPTSGLSMFAGSLFCNMEKLSKSRKGFVVQTGSSVCAVRGTEFFVASAEDGTTILQVSKGKVAFKGEDSEVLLKKNQESQVKLGGNPEKIQILKKRDWEEWHKKTTESIKGNESKILKICYKKMRKLDNEIRQLEKIKKVSSESEKELRKQLKIYKKKGDTANIKEFSRKAHIERRKAHSSNMKSYYKAEKAELIMYIAKQAYLSQTLKSKSTDKIFLNIEKIYNIYYTKYIAEIKAELRRRSKK